MKTLTKYSILGLVLVTAFGCKKETKLLDTKNGLSHSWKLTQQGTDVNKNYKFDVEEKNFVADSAKTTLQLKSDYTGYRVGVNSSFVDTLVWELRNNERVLYMNITNRGFENKLYYQFEYGTKTLILLDTTVSPGFYRSYERMD